MEHGEDTSTRRKGNLPSCKPLLMAARCPKKQSSQHGVSSMHRRVSQCTFHCELVVVFRANVRRFVYLCIGFVISARTKCMHIELDVHIPQPHLPNPVAVQASSVCPVSRDLILWQYALDIACADVCLRFWNTSPQQRAPPCEEGPRSLELSHHHECLACGDVQQGSALFSSPYSTSRWHPRMPVCAECARCCSA